MNGIIDKNKASTQSNTHLVGVGGGLKIRKELHFSMNSMAVCQNKVANNDVSVDQIICIYDHDHKFGFGRIIKDVYNIRDIDM